VPDSHEVVVPLPSQAKAPGFRDAFSTLAGMRVREVADDWLAIAPREGAGAIYPYFHLERLCDATARTTLLSRAATRPAPCAGYTTTSPTASFTSSA
jgi:hypothetical protein